MKLSNCEAMEYRKLVDAVIYGEENGYCHVATNLQSDNTFFYDCYYPLEIVRSIGKKGYYQARNQIQQINKNRLHIEFSTSSPEFKESWELTKTYCSLPDGVTIH